MWVQLDFNTSACWYLGDTVFMSWEYSCCFYKIVVFGVNESFLLVFRSQFQWRTQKWNKSSYFKVVVKVSQLIELDCGYCILFTKQFRPK